MSEAPRPGSDRSFGAVFVVVFLVLGLWPVPWGGAARPWALAVAAAFLVPTLLRPRVLRPLNLLWFRFGMLLHAIVSPVVMGLIFAVTVIPTGLALRLVGKDVLDLRIRGRHPRDSYWIAREQRNVEADSMRNQF